VRSREDGAGRHQSRRVAPQHTARRCHDERRGDAVSGDVADDESDLALGKLDEVVEIAADLARGAVEGGELPARKLRDALGQELLLDELRDLELLLQLLARADLRLLFPNELRDAQRRRGLRGEL